jgi:hypothetical protein
LDCDEDNRLETLGSMLGSRSDNRNLKLFGL